jgi:NADH dehydrogenase/NADH:ubiquinone oxidoreductase subunit G
LKGNSQTIIQQPTTKNMKVTIDGQSIEVEPGTTILQAARMIGGEVVPPAMCYYSKLKGSGGKCRCCLVEVSKGSEADPRPMPKLMASCVTILWIVQCVTKQVNVNCKT